MNELDVRRLLMSIPSPTTAEREEAQLAPLRILPSPSSERLLHTIRSCNPQLGHMCIYLNGQFACREEALAMLTGAKIGLLRMHEFIGKSAAQPIRFQAVKVS